MDFKTIKRLKCRLADSVISPQLAFFVTFALSLMKVMTRDPNTL
jgi:hypothetical protein